MRTTIDLDHALLEKAMKVSGAKTKKEVVDMALRALIRTKAKNDLLDLVGYIDIDAEFDHKRTRRTRYYAGR
ncbi:MAG: type II toxin-antitoxin system VapB family antitoxin [Hyphomicrobiales bacterium]|nr:type II toxin-antitoxin system VapB family antitoxin [Hyphomicrobiales bacterium]